MSKKSPSKPTPPTDGTKAKPPRKGVLREVRELWDTLVLAFVLVTMMKTFVVDLYKIPSGSMTPTLIGDAIAERDYNGDGREDLLVFDRINANPPYRLRQVFLRDAEGRLRCDTEELRSMQFRNERFSASSVELRYDRIFVNKMWYWFNPIRRGDIVVFKLPDRPNPDRSQRRERLYSPLEPFYIKRVAALGGETPTISNDGHIFINGEEITTPEIFNNNFYFNTQPVVIGNHWELIQPQFLGAPVPDGQFYVFGDNSGNSWDSRSWGGVENNRVRGRAFFRYWPLSHISFLR